MPQTVFVTGATGYIAKHIVQRLLNAGHTVVGSVRSLERGDEVRDAVRPHLAEPAAADERLRFAALDLTRDEGWDTALAGCDALMHTASPFPLEQPADEDEVIRPAVEGALRALRAAKAVEIGRVILTSSVVAIVNTPREPGHIFTEDDWTDTADPSANAYVKSKTLAERAAWDFVETEAPGIKLTTVNPGLVLGAPLDGKFGTSVRVVERVLRAKDPMQPRFGFVAVHVHDVAEMHLRALERPGTTGKRYIAGDRFMWFSDIAAVLKDAYPDRKIATREAPNLLIRGLALFDKQIRTILPNLGREDPIDNSRAQADMDIAFIDGADAVRETAAYLIERGKV